MKLRFLLLAFLFVPFFALPQKSALKKFIKAVKNQDEAAAQARCTPAYWNAEIDPGTRFYEQSVRKKFQLELVSKASQDKRAVLTVDILREGKKVDRVYMYCENRSGKWLVDGVDENEPKAKFFLGKHLSGHFHPKQLPSHPELEALAADMLAGRNNESGRARLFRTRLTHELSRIHFKKLEERPNGVRAQNFYWSETLKRGAITFANARGGDNGDFDEVLTVYVKRVIREGNPMWIIFGSGYSDVSARSFLSGNFQ